MPCTEAYKEHIMYTFNGFCKTVIRFAAINAWRDRSRRRQKEISLEYLTEEKFYPLGTTDEYFEAPYEEHPITICGQTVILTNGELAAALLSLPEKNQEIIFLYFFGQIKRMTKNHEAYEDGVITREEFLNRKNELNQQMEQVMERTTENRLIVLEEERREVPKDAVRAILQNFSMALSSDIDHTIRKRLLHLLIKEITVDRDRNIDSIKIRLSDDLIRFLQNSGGTPPDGAPSVFMFQEFGIKSLELELVI